MDDSVQPLFPVPSCAVFAHRRKLGDPVPRSVNRAYSGTLPMRDAPEEVADAKLTVRENVPALEVANFEGGSKYRGQFKQGATLVPRYMVLVDRPPAGKLGFDAARPPVVSRRSGLEKKPWKDLTSLSGSVEREFLRPVLLGESILPFRVWKPFEGVVPVTDKGRMLDAKAATDLGLQGLPDWMTRAEAAWEANKAKGTKQKYTDQLDYYGKLTAQFPISKLRLVYAKAGMKPAACLVQDERAVLDHKLYGIALKRLVEARYLSAILNSEEIRSRVAHMQSRGQWGARDFDKVMFNLPIPLFDADNPPHAELAAAGKQAEELAAKVDIPETVGFQKARSLVRNALDEADISSRIDALVARLLDGA
ncbi:MAG: hypothetical protein AAF764_06580 [Pseudomonadota bacterium]